MTTDEMKKKAAEFLIAQEIPHLAKNKQLRLGLGTGSTAIWGVRRLGEIIQEWKRSKSGPWAEAGLTEEPICIATSLQSQLEAQQYGLLVSDLNDPRVKGEIDFAFDGADEVNPQFSLIKGGGGAHAREKLVEHQAGRFVVVVDESKLVPVLAKKFPLPLEALPLAQEQLLKTLRSYGADVKVRCGSGKMGPVITDNGMILLDALFPEGLKAGGDFDPVIMEMTLKSLPGILEVGLFNCPVAAVYVGKADGSVQIIKPGPVQA